MKPLPEITLYQLNMRHIEIPDLKLSFNMPENLAECSTKEYLDLSYLVMQYLSGSINYEEFRIHAVCKLLNISVSPKYQADEDIMANIYRFSELCSSYFEDTPEGSKKLLLDFLQIKIPKVKTAFSTYYAPTESLFEITYGEFADASRIFDDFHSSGDVFNLYLLAAIIYRKRKAFTKKRMPYNANKLESQAKHFQKYTAPSFIYGVYLQFVAFKQYLPTAQIPWSGKYLNFEILFEGGEPETENSIPGIGADSMVFSLAESGVFGNTEKVRNTNFLEIMVHLYDLRKRDLERKKEEDRQNANSK